MKPETIQTGVVAPAQAAVSPPAPPPLPVLAPEGSFLSRRQFIQALGAVVISGVFPPVPTPAPTILAGSLPCSGACAIPGAQYGDYIVQTEEWSEREIRMLLDVQVRETAEALGLSTIPPVTYLLNCECDYFDPDTGEKVRRITSGWKFRV